MYTTRLIRVYLLMANFDLGATCDSKCEFIPESWTCVYTYGHVGVMWRLFGKCWRLCVLKINSKRNLWQWSFTMVEEKRNLHLSCEMNSHVMVNFCVTISAITLKLWFGLHLLTFIWLFIHEWRAYHAYVVLHWFWRIIALKTLHKMIKAEFF